MIPEELLEQIREATRDLHLAEQDEKNAEFAYIGVAIEKTNLARERLNLLYRRAKRYSSVDRSFR